MEIKNLERLTKTQIEERSTKVLEHFDARYFHYCKSTPIETIINNLSNLGYLQYDATSNLGYDDNKSRILGCFIPARKLILVDASLGDVKSKLHFVQAHELGHFALHRRVLLGDDIPSIVHDTENVFLGKRKLVTQYDFMEWQANYFASSILLPRNMLLYKLIEIRKDLGLAWRGTVYVDDQRCTREDYRQTLIALAEYFQVSVSVVEIRLHELSLITDNRTKKNGVRSISKLVDDMSPLGD